MVHRRHHQYHQEWTRVHLQQCKILAMVLVLNWQKFSEGEGGWESLLLSLGQGQYFDRWHLFMSPKLCICVEMPVHLKIYSKHDQPYQLVDIILHCNFAREKQLRNLLVNWQIWISVFTNYLSYPTNNNCLLSHRSGNSDQDILMHSHFNIGLTLLV